MIRRRRLITFGLLILVGVLSALDHAGVFGYRGSDRTRYQDAVVKVTHAADGDTLDVDLPDGDRLVTRVRLWGVDCPEIGHREGEPDAYFGREAAEFVAREIVGRSVRLVLEPTRPARDKYGRLLAYVYLADDRRLLNELLIERGLAYADPRYDHVLELRFIELEKTVRKQKTGLWAGVTPERMPEWRKRRDAAGTD